MTELPTRLVQLAHALGVEHQELAKLGGISKATFSGYVAGGRLPRADTIANWVRSVRVNANWLLTGEGEMLLDSVAGIPAGQLTDPVAQRVQIVVASMRANGASPDEIRGAIREALTGEPQATSAATSDDEATGEMLKAGNGR